MEENWHDCSTETNFTIIENSCQCYSQEPRLSKNANMLQWIRYLWIKNFHEIRTTFFTTVNNKSIKITIKHILVCRNLLHALFIVHKKKKKDEYTILHKCRIWKFLLLKKRIDEPAEKSLFFYSDHNTKYWNIYLFFMLFYLLI